MARILQWRGALLSSFPRFAHVFFWRFLLASDAKLFTPQSGRNLLRDARLEMAEMERAVLHPDEASDLQAQPLHDALDLAVLAFLEANRRPRIYALGALEVGD